MFDHVLAVVDGESGSERVLSWVRRVAREATTLRLLTVRPEARAVRAGDRVVAYLDQEEEAGRAAAMADLRRLAARMRDGFDTVLDVRFGDPATAVLDRASQTRADLIALVLRDVRGIRRLWAESLADRIVRWAPVPVLVVPDRGRAA